MARIVLGANDDDLRVDPLDRSGLPLLDLVDLQPNPGNPRKITSAEIEEMAEDLKKGQIQAINVMSRRAFALQMPDLVEKLTDARYVVINGNCRLAGAALSGILALRAEIHDEWMAADIKKVIIRENVHRIPLQPLLVGRQLVTMLPEYENKQTKLAAALTKPLSWVQQRIALTELTPELQAAHERGEVGFSLARECVRLHPELQVALAEQRIPVEAAREWLLQRRLSKAEQLAEWQASQAAPSTGPHPVIPPVGPARPGPDATGEKPHPEPTQEPRRGAEDLPDSSANGRPVTAGGNGHRGTGTSDTPGTDGHPVSVPGPSFDSTVATESPTAATNGHTPAAVFTLRITNPTPSRIADALADKLDPEDVKALASALRRRVRG